MWLRMDVLELDGAMIAVVALFFLSRSVQYSVVCSVLLYVEDD